MFETIKYDVDADGVATLTIDLPGQSMNVINEGLAADLPQAIDKVLEDDAVIGAVLTSGKESGFIAGADLRMLERSGELAKAGKVAELFEVSYDLNKACRKMESGGKSAKELGKGAGTKPFVAAINGLALGGGLEIALACHARFVADNDKIQLGQPEVQVGLIPGGGGTQRLPRLIGIQEALKMMTTGAPVKPEKAKRLGFITEVVPADGLIDAAKAWIKDNREVSQPWDKKGFKYPGGGGAMHPGSVQTFVAASAMAQRQTQHNYPAVERILSATYEGSIVPIDVGLRIESKYFTKCLMEPQTANMIRTLFINKQAAEKGEARPKSVEPMPVKKLGVLGAGMMGAGIAYVSAKAGMEVVLLDRELEYAEKGKNYSEKLVAKGVERGKTTQEKGDALLARITPTTDYNALKDVDFIIEAVFEDTSIKEDVIKKTEAVIGEDIIFASNTSTLPITGLSEFSKRPAQFVGVHFFSPVDKMPLVEIILGEGTQDKAVAQALDYVRQIKKTPIVVNDGRGFYANSVIMPYLGEAQAMVGEGISVALIENASKMLGMPVGPLALVDETSIELGYRIMKETREALGDAYPNHPGDAVLATMYDLGRMGRKNAKGYYEYSDDGKQIWRGVTDHFPLLEEQPDVEEVRTRLAYIQAIEAVRTMERNILRDPQSGDLGAIFGWGFAPWTGGPFSMMDTIGIEEFVRTADGLAQKYGERYAPPQILRDMAAKGDTFYKAA
ncbi:MAG: 3-hydroxyacyl-CoA dehydrogenase NAD-binding domain-containing protein [Pseudomonadota bacterium]